MLQPLLLLSYNRHINHLIPSPLNDFPVWIPHPLTNRLLHFHPHLEQVLHSLHMHLSNSFDDSFVDSSVASVASVFVASSNSFLHTEVDFIYSSYFLLFVFYLYLCATKYHYKWIYTRCINSIFASSVLLYSISLHPCSLAWRIRAKTRHILCKICSSWLNVSE